MSTVTATVVVAWAASAPLAGESTSNRSALLLQPSEAPLRLERVIEVEFTVQDYPPEEFPFLLEAVHCSGDFFERDFEFGIRALAL